MQRPDRRFHLGFIFSACVILSGCGGSGEGDNPRWEEYRNDAWGFKVLLPGTLRPDEFPLSGDRAGYIQSLIVSGLSGKVSYSVNARRLLNDSNDSVESRLDQLHGRIEPGQESGQRLSDEVKDGPFGKFREIRHQRDGTFPYSRTRFFVTPRYGYVVSVFGETANDLSSSDAERFFESFQITNLKQ